LTDPGPQSRLLGVAAGLIETPRFRLSLERWGDRLLRRVFSEAEREYAARKRDGHHNLAARFAAKCAGRRLVRGAFGHVPAWTDVEVIRRRSGEPTLAVRGLDLAGRRFCLSLTHDSDFAMASLFLEEPEEEPPRQPS
jgi:holo-[acyl-carrier protein] synthase